MKTAGNESQWGQTPLWAIDEFKSGLIAKATNGDMSEKDYKRCRDILMQVPELKSHIPAFIKSNHSANDFRSYMQAYNQHYADRRSLIHTEMDSLASYLVSAD